MHAPDLVLEVRTAPQDKSSFEQTGPNAWAIPRDDPNDSLVRQLTNASAANTGTIPSGVLRTAKSVSPEQRLKLFAAVIARYQGKVSAARLELQRRLKRSPLTVAKELSGHYGHELNNVVYIPAVALIGRLRLGQLTDDSAQLSRVE